MRCPKKSSGLRLSSIFSTAAVPYASLNLPQAALGNGPIARRSGPNPLKQNKKDHPKVAFFVLAEKEGFEPSRQLPSLLP